MTSLAKRGSCRKKLIINDDSSQEKPAKKTKAQQDPESEMNVYEEGADETRSGGNDKFELLKTEGQPGWMEKLLKKVPLY